MTNLWFRISLFNFAIASSMGLLLRYATVYPVEKLNLQFLLHGHSHGAMLGWAYMAIYALIYEFFVEKTKLSAKCFNTLFWFTQVSVLGMFVFFPIEGYALFSIISSALHLFCSYIFLGFVWRFRRKSFKLEPILLYVALGFMCLSTIGIWLLGPAIATQGKGSALFQGAIQFFLHFQFNGWFTLAVLALLLSDFTVLWGKRSMRIFALLLSLSVILTYALPLLWYVDSSVLFVFNGLGVLLQLVVFCLIAVQLRRQASLMELGSLSKSLFCFCALSMLLKAIAPLLLFAPSMMVMVNHIRPLVVGFIHLLMLGGVSGGILFLALRKGWLPRVGMLVRMTVILFIAAFVFTEALMLCQGWFIMQGISLVPSYQLWLLLGSSLLPLSVVLLFVAALKGRLRARRTGHIVR